MNDHPPPRRRGSGAVAGTIAAVVLLTGCSAVPSFGSALTTSIGESAGGTFALSDVTGLTGSSFLVVCPYETPASIEERLGFAWPEAPDSQQSDDRQTIAVVGGGAVTDTAELPRDPIDFCSDGPWDLLPVDTELAVTQSDDQVLVTVASR